MRIFSTGRLDGSGWCAGHMAKGPLRNEAVGVKFAHQPKGDAGFEWRTCKQAITLSVLISGKFKMDFRNVPGTPPLSETVVLDHQGAYVIFGPGIEHRSEALEDTLFLTLRWPSIEGDCQIVAPDEDHSKGSLQDG